MADLALPAVLLERVELEELAQPVLLASRSPEPDGTDVPLDAAIVLTLLARGLDLSAVHIWVRDQLAFAEGRAEHPYTGPRAGVEEVPGVVRITLDPLTPLESQARIEVRMEVSLAGEAAWSETYAFEVADVTAPRLVAAQALSPTRIALSFDEPVELGDFDATFIAEDVPAMGLWLLEASADGARVELAIRAPMTPDVRYRLTVRGVHDLKGNPITAPLASATFAGFRSPRPVARRFDLWSMLPRYNRREDTTGDLRKLIACFQEVLDLVLAEIDRFSDLIDLERAPEPFVDLMLADLGNPFEFVLNDLDKRRLVSVLVELYRLKGTEKGIRNAARLFLGIELGTISTYTSSPLILGESLLGIDWELGPSSRFALYAFEVRVPVVLNAEQRRRLRTLIEWAKPAHTHLIDIVEPTVVDILDEWLLGLSELGANTILV